MKSLIAVLFSMLFLFNGQVYAKNKPDHLTFNKGLFEYYKISNITVDDKYALEYTIANYTGTFNELYNNEFKIKKLLNEKKKELSDKLASYETGKEYYLKLRDEKLPEYDFDNKLFKFNLISKGTYILYSMSEEAGGTFDRNKIVCMEALGKGDLHDIWLKFDNYNDKDDLPMSPEKAEKLIGSMTDEYGVDRRISYKIYYIISKAGQDYTNNGLLYKTAAEKTNSMKPGEYFEQYYYIIGDVQKIEIYDKDFKKLIGVLE